MRGEWKCRDWEFDYWQHKLVPDIQYLYKYRKNSDTLEYTRYDITPGQIGQVLSVMGWEAGDIDYDGSEVYDYYSHTDYPNAKLVVYSNGTTFKLTLYFVEED